MQTVMLHLISMTFGCPLHIPPPPLRSFFVAYSYSFLSPPPLLYLLSCTSSPLPPVLQILNQQRKIEAVKAHNFTLLSNILPNHVVNHFLNPDIQSLVRNTSLPLHTVHDVLLSSCSALLRVCLPSH